MKKMWLPVKSIASDFKIDWIDVDALFLFLYFEPGELRVFEICFVFDFKLEFWTVKFPIFHGWIFSNCTYVFILAEIEKVDQRVTPGSAWNGKALWLCLS